MGNTHKKLTVAAIGIAPKPWSVRLEQDCLTDVSPFFVMDETARSAP